MSSYPSYGQTPQSTSAASGPPADPNPDHNGSEQVRRDGLGETVSQLSRDLASLKNTVTLLASQAGGGAAKAVRDIGQSVASQVGDAASGAADSSADLAATAKEHVKTFASELEGMARRNPLGTIAGTLLVGIVIGMMSRGRG